MSETSYDIEIWIRQPDTDEGDPFKPMWFTVKGTLTQAIAYCKMKLKTVRNASGSAAIYEEGDEEMRVLWSI